MRAKTFEHNLPEGYREAFIIDAKDKGTIVKLNIAGIVVFIVIFLPLLFYCFSLDHPFLIGLGPLIGLIVIYTAYVFAHELTHGAAYWLLTRQRLTFGLGNSIAYCGLPNAYVYRKPALIATLAPFVVFTVVFSVALVLSASPSWKIVWSFILSAHIAGCIGDLWVAYILAVRYRGRNDLLVRDSGPTQYFYVK